MTTKTIGRSKERPSRDGLRARTRITLATIKSALKAPRKPTVVHDTELNGLALRVSLRRAFWSYTYSPHGTNPATGKRWGSTRFELGDVQTTTLPEARRAALAAKALVQAGRDPQREKTALKRAASATRGMAARASMNTAEALDAYENALIATPTETVRRKSSEKTRRQACAYARKAVRLMQAETLDPSAIDVGAVRRMLDGLNASDAERWHVFGGLSRFLSWCAKRGMATGNPCNAFDRDEKPKPGKARDNAPDIETLRNVWRAVEREAPEVRDLARFLLLAPLRLNEAAGLRWSEVDLNRGWIRIDGARMKNGEAHELPLNKPALEILTRRSGAVDAGVRSAPEPSSLVFVSLLSAGAFQSWTRVTLRVRHAIGQEGHGPDRQFRWHDVRRSFVTHLAEEFDEAVLDSMLAHRRRGVAGVYQKQRYLNRRPAVMARWAEMLTGDASTESNVVPLRTSATG